jgi:iron(III) transport system ATP-binding protein
MTVAENILFGLHGMSKAAAKERLGEMLSRTALEGFDDRYPAELSGGESRRVSLARTLAPAPKILLLDEPLTNVDPDLKATLLKLVIEIVVQEKTTMLYVTHDKSDGDEGRASWILK